jgi:hypothetical protein
MMIDIRGWTNFILIPYSTRKAAGFTASGLFVPVAFSSEVGTGSREENASK